MYLADVIMFPNTFDGHLKDVADVLNVLKRAGLSLNMPKCTFFSDRFDYLGYVIMPGKL